MENVENAINCHLHFERNVQVINYIDVTVAIAFVTSTVDPVDMRIVPYPCRGFKVSLQFEEGLFYDCGFFSAVASKKLSLDRGTVIRQSNSITFQTNDWVLPGEGVVVYYYSPAEVTRRISEAH